ncbi:MAG: AAA family ATPase, partial [bacterium]|nr:AAA family ATPase [bacterium]
MSFYFAIGLVPASAQQSDSSEHSHQNGSTFICNEVAGRPGMMICARGEGTTARPNVETPAQSEDDGFPIFFIIFSGIAISSLIALFLFFRGARSKKLKAKAPTANEKNEEPQFFSKDQILWIKILYVVELILILLMPLAEHWIIAVALFIALAVITLSNWDMLLEVRRSFRSGDIGGHVITDETTTFKDVGGLEEAIEELRDVVALYKNPKEAELWDIRKPTGMLLIGPPGCGKTLLARATAGEANMNFIAFLGAEIGSSYVRSGAQEVKDIFAKARIQNPTLLF